MACRNAYKKMMKEAGMISSSVIQPVVETTVDRLLFGVDSKTQANDLLQNNISEFEWIVRNKIYPNFFGRHINGEGCLTKDEIKFLHGKGCKIAPVYIDDSGEKLTEEQGAALAKKIDVCAFELGIPVGKAIFLEINEAENVTSEFMIGYTKALIEEGYTPGFKANTDAKYSFDREFSRATRIETDIFNKCLIWAVAPTVAEYDGITTSHLIHPDNWRPFAPSAITRREIAIWQYGKDCHPIEDDMGQITTFNLNLIRNANIVITKMF
ncbi:MAG: hypothetical protein E7653_02090 [Ruminococcaceae bacterium]|nr:hypothetical protein [Oscillospiraceae bacterium]